ncbi:two-component regulator propeller domain-containing protein [Xanthomonas graminis]|uniref:two-component regulator propeller domain-containing protein n=1 Tax=Xanthomonas graminis TaxID=3390026 RepID=UPI00396AA37F
MSTLHSEGSVLWVVAGDALQRYDTARRQWLPAPVHGAQALACDAQQRLWAVDVDGQVWREDDDGGGLRPLPTPALPAARSLLGDRDGNLWLGSNAHGLLRIARSRIGLLNPWSPMPAAGCGSAATAAFPCCCQGGRRQRGAKRNRLLRKRRTGTGRNQRRWPAGMPARRRRHTMVSADFRLRADRSARARPAPRAGAADADPVARRRRSCAKTACWPAKAARNSWRCCPAATARRRMRSANACARPCWAARWRTRRARAIGW